jgi:predicted PurR-regulated permease PerM
MRRIRWRFLRRRQAALSLLLAAAALLAGCGSSANSSSSSSSSASSTSSTSASAKPSYCASLHNLEASVKAIPSVSQVKHDGVNGLKSAASNVQMNATTLVNDAKSQFASQTGALKSSVDTLSRSVQGMSSPPTADQLKALPGQVTAVATATKNLKNAASPSCA